MIYVSATPGDYEMQRADGRVVEQLIRPTGLLDPRIEVRPASTQVDDLLEEIRRREERGEAVLVTTLTKRMAEDLTEYYENVGVRVRYLHSDIDTLERVELIREMRRGAFNVLIGINLLREGLDIPEVSLVAILDADKEGFLRSERSLVQTCGRAARNAGGMVILYADRVTRSMQYTIDETNRRRAIQDAYNREHGIEPRTIISAVKDSMTEHLKASGWEGQSADRDPGLLEAAEPELDYRDLGDLRSRIRELEKKMHEAAAELEFEEAAMYRDQVKKLKQLELELG
ncbi:hypothetical protein GF1_15490 [Desulfolithobacter dissulfuricans]|uniref:UvrABC system protein B n=1 Tax=Desulfolithobacter dissulfuricans TaxID=2795293 RepID=A0A915U0A4_9BACT|nr:hypothetical protein GF1_15490 [Desulfolithobacter dissulfuricans]